METYLRNEKVSARRVCLSVRALYEETSRLGVSGVLFAPFQRTQCWGSLNPASTCSVGPGAVTLLALLGLDWVQIKTLTASLLMGTPYRLPVCPQALGAKPNKTATCPAIKRLAKALQARANSRRYCIDIFSEARCMNVVVRLIKRVSIHPVDKLFCIFPRSVLP